MKKLTLLVALIFISNAFSCSEHGGFLPENDMKISVGDKFSSDMTEERFNEIIDEIEAVYAPIVREKGGRLKVKRKWDNDTVNASAMQLFGSWIVNMYGGLARHPDVTDDGFALVVCHELGHHLAGAPTNGFPRSWASNEGQSDYFATLKCFRKVYGSEDNISIVANMNVAPHAKKMCEASWSNAEDVALCIRSAMAGKSLATLLAGTRGGPVDFNTPDDSVVGSTVNSHPAGQCRLDTYFEGALCTVESSSDVSSSDATVGTCNRSTSHQIGNRPLCWYKP